MLYSKTAKYAVLALAEIARRATEGFVATHAVSEAISIPYAHFAKTIAQLKRAGLVTTARGKTGGIHLARPAGEISILDVVLAIDGAVHLNDCPLFLEPCECGRDCSLHPLWKEARDGVVAFLTRTTIADVANALETARP